MDRCVGRWVDTCIVGRRMDGQKERRTERRKEGKEGRGSTESMKNEEKEAGRKEGGKEVRSGPQKRGRPDRRSEWVGRRMKECG